MSSFISEFNSGINVGRWNVKLSWAQIVHNIHEYLIRKLRPWFDGLWRISEFERHLEWCHFCADFFHRFYPCKHLYTQEVFCMLSDNAFYFIYSNAKRLSYSQIYSLHLGHFKSIFMPFESDQRQKRRITGKVNRKLVKKCDNSFLFVSFMLWFI